MGRSTPREPALEIGMGRIVPFFPRLMASGTWGLLSRPWGLQTGRDARGDRGPGGRVVECGPEALRESLWQKTFTDNTFVLVAVGSGR